MPKNRVEVTTTKHQIGKTTYLVCVSPSDRATDSLDRKIRTVKQAKAQRGKRVNREVPYGYLADPNDRNHPIPDPETAHVVKQIFAVYVPGDRICEIQNWLRDNEILTVGELRYRRKGGKKFP